MKKWPRKKTFVWMVCLSILATFTVGLPLAVAADTGLEVSASVGTVADGPQLISRDQYDAVYTAPDGVVDKKSYVAKYEKFNPFESKIEGGVSPLHIVTLSGYNSMTITPPGGAADDIVATFDDTLNVGFTGSGSVDGNSHTYWLGLTPFNADRVTLTDQFTFTGIGCRFSL